MARAKKQDVRSCRECGCTDLDCSQCIERTGAPCSWVDDDPCSACRDALIGAMPAAAVRSVKTTAPIQVDQLASVFEWLVQHGCLRREQLPPDTAPCAGDSEVLCTISAARTS